MDVKKSLIALSVSVALLGGVWESAVAKNADEEDSVYRWGRWAVLSPAAGAEEVIAFAPAGTNDIGRCESEANCPGFNTPQEEPPVTQVPCEAGMPCGFTRVGGFVENEEAPGNVEIFELVLDEETGELSYRVAPGATGEIASGELPANIRTGTVTTVDRTSLRGILERDGELNPALVQGLWQQQEQRGEFFWGVAATEGQMNDLVNGLGAERIATYRGVMANNPIDGAVVMTVDFNTSTWSGDFAGRFNFSASGDVVEHGFASTDFTDAQISGLVEGAFVNAGNNAIGGYEVEHAVEGLDADVFNAKLVTEPVVVPAGLN